MVHHLTIVNCAKQKLYILLLLGKGAEDNEKMELQMKSKGIRIEMIDSGCWEVFSKDESLINRLAAKFKDIKFLNTDFLTNDFFGISRSNS